ncbi:FAD-binding oxidoreductase [Sphingomonas lacunae]|uniref:FAD-binding oxidoreductase n=1 Tax=Sphingomonas lacunae TaxID=2698828 RepID=A0A6M4APX6_9SPHN|nr:FAD-binding oxidoreductase [Sphingomonas lacunae]QJQ31077.1 FAD-binding oxidoreductase [Sphingomonas lacunae]
MAMQCADFLVIGGGIAGLSAAARLTLSGNVTVIEAETALGYHSSGRSATFCHYGIGNATVRGLTSFSRAFFQEPPAGFSDYPLAKSKSALFIATEAMLPTLAELATSMRRFTDTISEVDEAGMLELVPVLRTGQDAIIAGVVDSSGLKLDTDALMQGYARIVRRGGGTIINGQRVGGIHRSDGLWQVTTADGSSHAAPILVNAAGAWADQLAALAGVRPLGLEPKRRTMIVIDPPAGMAVNDWPFTKTATDDFYMLPDSGRLMASPVDEVPSEPCDAQPEEYDLALAAWQAEQYTTLPVVRIAHRWAGLRSFVADRVPTAGFAPDAPGFFWLAGQGGYGIQTAPAMAAISAALITGGDWPKELTALGVTPAKILPDRLLG